MIQYIAPYHGYRIFVIYERFGIEYEITRNYCGRNVGKTNSNFTVNLILTYICSYENSQ